jgi:hypothetical protein
MDMHSREQYLERVREEYRNASKRAKTRLLNEARKRTRLNRKVLVRKLAHPAKPDPGKRGSRKATYGADVVTALVKVWEIFDYPCGQRLAPAVREELDRLREAKELRCSPEVAEKLKRISPKTMDRLLAREKRVRGLRQNRNPSVHPLLYQKIPVKVASEWDTQQIGNLQVDYVLHSGRSLGGEFLHTISAADIATGWWECEAILRRTQEATRDGMDRMRKRLPFRILEIHPDNDTGMINNLMWEYCKKARIKMSRSRPYKKNDNAWVEQRNWTHVRKQVGYRRMDSQAELELLNSLYEKLRLYKNFFQPTMKLIEKIREGGKIHRKYDEPRTPYQRLIESGQIPASTKKRLKQQYESMNVAELRRQIETLKDRLFKLVEGKPKAAASKAKRHGPGIQLNNRRAHAIWMQQMLRKGEKEK